MTTISLATLITSGSPGACGLSMNSRVEFAEDRLYVLVLDASEPAVVLSAITAAHPISLN